MTKILKKNLPQVEVNQFLRVDSGYPEPSLVYTELSSQKGLCSRKTNDVRLPSQDFLALQVHKHFL